MLRVLVMYCTLHESKFSICSSVMLAPSFDLPIGLVLDFQTLDSGR